MGQERVVAGVLPMVGVESPKRPGDSGPGADDRTINVDGQPRELQPCDGVGDEVVIELDEWARVACVNRRTQLATVWAVGCRNSFQTVTRPGTCLVLSSAEDAIPYDGIGFA